MSIFVPNSITHRTDITRKNEIFFFFITLFWKYLFGKNPTCPRDIRQLSSFLWTVCCDSPPPHKMHKYIYLGLFSTHKMTPKQYYSWVTSLSLPRKQVYFYTFGPASDPLILYSVKLDHRSSRVIHSLGAAKRRRSGLSASRWKGLRHRVITPRGAKSCRLL